MSKAVVENLIVGAGPSGLAVAGRFTSAGIPFSIIEKGAKPGWAWHNHYDRLHLHTVKELSALPGLPFPEEYPRYVPKQQLTDYFTAYCSHFGIEPQYGNALQSVEQTENGLWLAKTDQGFIEAQRVIFSTGYNRIPNMPQWPNQTLYTGSFSHSKTYKNAKPYKGKSVLVVGMGNTGAEIALDLAENGAKPAISIRNAVNIIPRDFWGRPTQRTAIMLNKLPEGLRDKVSNLLQKLAIGNLSKYGAPTPKYAPSYQVRNHARIPVIDIGTVRHIKRGTIKMMPGIEGFDEGGVVFTDGVRLPFDAVILATGYHSQIQEFVNLPDEMFNSLGHPAHLWHQSQLGLFFLGFAAPSTGILRSIIQDSEKIVDHIKANRSVNAALLV